MEKLQGKIKTAMSVSFIAGILAAALVMWFYTTLHVGIGAALVVGVFATCLWANRLYKNIASEVFLRWRRDPYSEPIT